MENTVSKEKQHDPVCWEVSRDSNLHTASAGRAAIPRHTGWGTSGCSCEGLMGCLDSLESEWITARISKEIWVFRRRLTQGFAYCFSTGAQNQCSIQLCHSQMCQVSQRPGGHLNHLVAQVTALPVSCCQCLQLWHYLVLCNDSIWSHFSMRGMTGAT